VGGSGFPQAVRNVAAAARIAARKIDAVGKQDRTMYSFLQ
jgi:hypothetical protein